MWLADLVPVVVFGGGDDVVLAMDGLVSVSSLPLALVLVPAMAALLGAVVFA